MHFELQNSYNILSKHMLFQIEKGLYIHSFIHLFFWQIFIEICNVPHVGLDAWSTEISKM